MRICADPVREALLTCVPHSWPWAGTLLLATPYPYPEHAGYEESWAKSYVGNSKYATIHSLQSLGVLCPFWCPV